MATREWRAGSSAPELIALADTARLVVALDFDGTAAPFVVDPMAARALPEIATQIDRLASLPDTVVAYVSGRSMHDLREITEHSDDSLIALAGSHGAEYHYPGEPSTAVETAAEREELWAAARPIIDRYPGAELEPKTFGMGVHTRRADKATEQLVFAEIDALVAERFGHMRRRLGHHVLEFSSRTEGKDAAIATLRDRFNATGILFAGDDVTDEDAMRVLRAGDLGVRVGAGETAAALRVEHPQQIALLLEELANERAVRRGIDFRHGLARS